MHDHFDLGAAFLALCSGGDPLAQRGIVLALLAAGFVGGFAHCGPMCGPFVLMQIGRAPAQGFALRRLAAGTLPLYQLGRLLTYSLLGAVAGGLGASFIALTQFHWAISALLALAAISFLAQGLRSIFRLPPLAATTRLGARFGAVIARLAARFGTPHGFLLGIVLGFLPCGFLYAALGAAAATGSALVGSAAMAAFGLGTIPALAVIGVAGSGLAARWRRVAAACLPAVFLLNAVTLGGLAFRLAT